MALPVDICNWALLRLGEPRVNSIEPPYTDAGGVAASCGFLFPLARDAELRAHLWTFARKRASLAEDGSEPLHGFDHQFRLPTDFLRLVNEEQNDWQIEGRFILTDDTAPLYLTYIAKITDTALFDPLFVEALSCKLALDLAEKITTSASKKQAIENDYEKAIAKAKRTNAIEQPSRIPPEDTFVTVRR